MSKQINIVESNSGFNFRSTNSIDESHFEFEQLAISNIPMSFDDLGLKLDWSIASFWNHIDYAKLQEQKYFLFQIEHIEKKFKFQIIVYIEQSKIPFFKTGIIKQWPIPLHVFSDEEIENLIGAIEKMLKKNSDILSLRIQMYLPGKDPVARAKKILEKCSFKTVEAVGAAHTRFVNLTPDVDKILLGFEKRRREKLFLKGDEAEVLPVKSDETIVYLQKALDEAFLRTIQKPCPYKFKPMLDLFNKNENQISIYGFFFKDSNKVPSAFVTGISHVQGVEYSVGGSLSDERLRKYVFNNILLWKLISDAKDRGLKWFDLGGISSGADGDPTAGISMFKRKFPGVDLEVNCEMLKILKPGRAFLYELFKKIIGMLRK